jgi:hypothetical protein
MREARKRIEFWTPVLKAVRAQTCVYLAENPAMPGRISLAKRLS